MKIQMRSRIIVFTLSFLVYVALTDIKDYQEVIAAVIIALLISLSSGRMLVTGSTSKPLYARLIAGVVYLFIFLWEMLKANIHVAYIVIHPKLPIKPGIVKIKTKLKSEAAVTMLTSSITLTPGTLTVDVNKSKNELYIHWITAVTTDVDEATDAITGTLEKYLKGVFE
ncbi:MAG: Na+/H+ antiporter subunit E [bacterium]